MKFSKWFDKQEGVVKAAVITTIITFVGLFVTGCFSIIAAIIGRSSSPPTNTHSPTLVISTPSLIANISPTLITQLPHTIVQPVIQVTETPSSSSSLLEHYVYLLPTETLPLVFGAIGIAFISLGVFTTIRLFRNDEVIAIIIVSVMGIIFTIYWLHWWSILVIMFAAIFFSFILEVIPIIAKSIFGASIGILLGIGASFLYLAIPGPFIIGYIIVGMIIFGIFGALIGLMFGAIQKV